MKDELNPEYIFQITHAEILVLAALGKIDLVKLAKKELAQRGLDDSGKWVGFEKAAEIHGV